ncbi:peptide ABC transporter substrate-binding protein [Rhodocista pekingensis]|uniref:Peptide ABC transporter substrate-binding protein n=1 Tax=Rhodocista pekingensis TaxID=201185 RepID=A0ABW2KWH3_9PROT
MGWRAKTLLLPLLAALLCWGPPAGAAGVLHRGNGADPETLDPHAATGFPEAHLFYDLYEGLVARGPDGRYGPGLAERWEESEDGRTVTFHLRPDGRWSDGSPITADDVVWSFRRLVDPASGTHNAQYLWVIENAKDFYEGRLTDPDRVGIRALDPLTVEFRLARRTPYFVSMLSFPFLVPLPKEKVEALGREFFRAGTLVSSGGYRLVEQVPQGHVRLERNPYHRDAAATAIDTVYFYPTENQETELKRYRAGELDVTFTLPPGQVPWARVNLPQDLRTTPLFGTYYYSVNLTHEPWKSSPGLRRALAMTVDRDVIVEKITRAGEVPSVSYVPPGAAGYDPQVPDWAGWPMQRRVAEAQRLLAEAGYPGGKGPDGRPLSVELMFNTAENHRRIAVALAGMWQQRLGIQATLTNQEWKVFLASRRTKAYRDLARNSYVGAYADPNVFLEFLRADVGPENASAYANPAFDALLDAAGEARDPERRRALLAEAERLVLTDQPVIPVFTYADARLVSPRVTGWIDNPLNAHPTRFLALRP